MLPGHYATLNLKDKTLVQTKYWSVLDAYKKPKIKIDEKEALQELDTLCTNAFQYRMVSDVPVGVFLSGGYDSSLVTSILQKNTTNKIKTYTIGFKDAAFNEADHAKKVAEYLGTEHNEYFCTIKEAQDIIPTLPYFYDEPFGDSSAIPTILVSRFARQQVTVALSADGGDEIFAGYSRYDKLNRIHQIQQKLPEIIKKIGAQAIKILPATSMRKKKMASLLIQSDLLTTSDLVSSHFLVEDLQQLISTFSKHEITLNNLNSIPNLGLINTLLAADYKTYLPDDILTKIDRAAMSVGLEGREPWLDHRIIEWAAQLPVELKYNKGNKKYLLKQLTHQYLPEQLMNRPKMGFGIPFGEWLKGDLKPLVLATINEDSLAQQNILNKEFVLNLLDDYFAGRSKDDWQIWLIFMFLLWWKEWM